MSTPSLIEIGSVTTADRHRENLVRTPRPTYIVTAAQMRERGDHTIAQALGQVPGVFVVEAGGFGATSSVHIRGSNASDQVLMLLDGFPIAVGSNGYYDLSTLSTAGVERIEVIEGGASTLYGSGAVAGVINIITGQEQRPAVTLATGSFGDHEVTATDAHKLGNGVLGVALDRHVASNAYPYPAARSYGSSSGFAGGSRINADAQLSEGRFSYNATLGSGLYLTSLLDTSSLHQGDPNRLPTTDYATRSLTSNTLLASALERRHERSDVTLALSAQTHDSVYTDDASLANSYDGLALPAGTLQSDTYDDRRFDVSLRDVLMGKHARLLTGIDQSSENANIGEGISAITSGLAPFNAGARQSQQAFYAQYEHDIAQTGRFYAGLRDEHDTPLGHQLLPAVGAKIPLGAVQFAINASTALRVPTLNDLYYPGYSNPSLLPEHSRNIDMTLSHQDGLSLGFFARTLNNLIASDPATYIPYNTAHAKVEGLTATWASQPFDGLVLKVSYTDTFEALSIAATGDTRLPFTPVSMTKVALEHAQKGNALGFGFDATLASATPQSRGTLPEWATVNAFVSAPLSSNVMLRAQARNIGNEAYELSVGYPLPGRSYEVELATR